MIRFIYGDPRYKSASNGSTKARAALFVMLDFIAGKITESATWIITITLAYLLFVIFYSNMVLFGNFSQRGDGLIQIAYTLAFFLTAAIFVMFAALMAAYIIASISAPFRTSVSQGMLTSSKALDSVKKHKIYLYGKSVSDNFSRIFYWKSNGKKRNQIMLLLLSIFAFYYSWSTTPNTSLRAYKYHILPDFLMLSAWDIYSNTYPYVVLLYEYINPALNILYNFVHAKIVWYIQQ